MPAATFRLTHSPNTLSTRTCSGSHRPSNHGLAAVPRCGPKGRSEEVSHTPQQGRHQQEGEDRQEGHAKGEQEGDGRAAAVGQEDRGTNPSTCRPANVHSRSGLFDTCRLGWGHKRECKCLTKTYDADPLLSQGSTCLLPQVPRPTADPTESNPAEETTEIVPSANLDANKIAQRGLPLNAETVRGLRQPPMYVPVGRRLATVSTNAKTSFLTNRSSPLYIRTYTAMLNRSPPALGKGELDARWFPHRRPLQLSRPKT